MAFGDQINVPAEGAINATVDPQAPAVTVGPANAVEIATGPTPCTIVIECNNDGFMRTFTNASPGKSWTGLTITKVYGASSGTTATAVRLRWGATT